MNWSRWRLLVLGILVCGLFFAKITQVSAVWAETEVKTIKVGIYDNKPKVYRDETGLAAGLFPDILNYIAKQENWKLEYVFGTWEEGLARLEKGEIDVMVDVAITPERQQRFDFTGETVLSSWGIIFVQKNADIDSFQDLSNKKIAILKSSVYLGGPEGVDKYIQTFNLNVEFVYVDEYAQVFELLNKGEVDAAVVSRVFALTNQKNYPNIKETDMFFSPTELRFGLTKGANDNQHLRDRLDHWVKKLKSEDNGVYQQFLKRHGLSGMIIRQEVIPAWVLYLGLAATVILLLSLVTIVGLRRARVIMHKKLEEKEALLSSVISHTPIIIFAFDNQGIISLAAGQALKGDDLKQGFRVGQSIFNLFKDNQNIINQIKNTLKGEIVEFKSELATKTWRLSFSPVIIAQQVVSVVGVAIDLTEEVKLDHAKMEFLSLVSHHLRTLPTGLRWTLELLSPKIEKVLTQKELKHWQSLEETNLKMIDLANTISRASQLEVGKFDIFPEKFDLSQLIDEEIDELKSQIEKKHLKFTKNYHEMTEVICDKNHLKLIVHNLLSNAVRYISAGGSVTIGLSSGSDKFTLKIQDTGWGIPKNQQAEVFSKLFRGDNVAKVDVTGMGLGLFIVKSIVEKSGGKIWFESEENRGSTFYVELPQKRI